MKETGVTPEQRSILEATVRKYKTYIRGNANGLEIIGQIIIAASNELKIHPLRDLQEICMTEGMNVQFVCIPVGSEINRIGELNWLTTGDSIPSDVANYDIRMPHSGNQLYPYWLWIVINRWSEYDNLLRQLGVTEEENLNRLSQTGILGPKPGSELSRMSNSAQN